MTSVMLASYPDLFAGGAIIAGLALRGGSSLMQALDLMKGYDRFQTRSLTLLVRGASENIGEWPKISVWHGSDDRTVNPSNADKIVRQWQALHGAADAPTRIEMVDGYPRRVWCDSKGREVIEEFRIPRMGHGAPLQAEGADGYGASGDYMLEVGICSTKHIVSFWGLSAQQSARQENYTNDNVGRRTDALFLADALTCRADRTLLHGGCLRRRHCRWRHGGS